MVIVSRNVYPVGQGGFCSEIHGIQGGIIVYDCGCKSNKKIGKAEINLVANALPKREIDALFISHFHEDHTSLIGELIKGRRVKKLYIPYMNSLTKRLIAVLCDSELLHNVIMNPSSVFKDTEIIVVNPLEGSESVEHSTETTYTHIESGKSIELRPYWEYVPYNVYSDRRINKFIAACKKKKVDIAQLSDVKYVSNKIGILKKIYKSIEGGINQNSLILYSGPITDNCEQIIECCRCIHVEKAGCLYTGDYEYGDIDKLNVRIGPRRENIGTLQIPHHGASTGWNSKILHRQIHTAFVQFGNNNTYGHPSTTVIDNIVKRIHRRCMKNCCCGIHKVTGDIVKCWGWLHNQAAFL